jgi:hypothetical protein
MGWANSSCATDEPHKLLWIINWTAVGADQQGIRVGQVEVGGLADRTGLRAGYKPTTINVQRVMLGGVGFCRWFSLTCRAVEIKLSISAYLPSPYDKFLKNAWLTIRADCAPPTRDFANAGCPRCALLCAGCGSRSGRLHSSMSPAL